MPESGESARSRVADKAGGPHCRLREPNSINSSAGHSSAARVPPSACRCLRTTSWSAPSSSTARRCGRSLTSRSSWSQTSPLRPSSRSRTRGCSTSCANPCSSRPRPPMCSRSSVARPASWSQCSRRCWRTPRESASAKFGNLLAARRRRYSVRPRCTAYRPPLSKHARARPIRPGAATHSRSCRQTKQVVHIADLRLKQDYLERQSAAS